MGDESIEVMLKKLRGIADKDDSQPEGIQRPLEEVLAHYLKKQPLKVGDIVRFKPNLCHVRQPTMTTDCIVVEVLETPYITQAEGEHHTPYFRERLDIRLGFYMKDGEFALIHFDSRRFEKVTKKE
ncbi:MAG: hypothetical protein WC100_01375 [Sterolibacterium sp.]